MSTQPGKSRKLKENEMVTMIRLVVFAIYVAGVAFISWYMPILRSALGTFVFLIVLFFYLLGVSKAAEFIGGWLLNRHSGR